MLTSATPGRVPRRRPGIALRRDEGGSRLQDRGGHDVCALNDTAAALWELCDGLTTADEMVEAICELSLLGRDAVVGDVLRTLAEFEGVGVIEWAGEDP